MRLTKNQKKEIEFYKNNYNINPTEEEIEEYINYTVYGKGNINIYKKNVNCIFTEKRKLEILSKCWLKDLNNDLLFPNELYNDIDCVFWRKYTKGIILQSKYKM